MKKTFGKRFVPVVFAALIAVAGGVSAFMGTCGCGGSGSGDIAAPSEIRANESNVANAPAAGAVKASARVIFVELGSENCIPCRMMKPVMQKIESRFAGQVKVVFHDVWTAEGRPYAMKYGIRAIPTQVFLDAGGSEFFRHEGFFSEEEIVRLLKTKGVE
jgi:thioredoxin 1